MGKLKNWGLLICLTVLLWACRGASRPAESIPGVDTSQTYYTQVGMFYEKGRYRTTNYGVGIFLPVNTEIRPVEFNRKYYLISVVKTGEKIEVYNKEKFSGWTQQQSFKKLFSTEPVSMMKFNASERKNIKTGSISPGMRKSAVLVSRGYPPSHETPSLERNQWKYWKSRWDTEIVSFENDRVTGIRD